MVGFLQRNERKVLENNQEGTNVSVDDQQFLSYSITTGKAAIVCARGVFAYNHLQKKQKDFIGEVLRETQQRQQLSEFQSYCVGFGNYY